MKPFRVTIFESKKTFVNEIHLFLLVCPFTVYECVDLLVCTQHAFVGYILFQYFRMCALASPVCSRNRYPFALWQNKKVNRWGCEIHTIPMNGAILLPRTVDILQSQLRLPAKQMYKEIRPEMLLLLLFEKMKEKMAHFFKKFTLHIFSFPHKRTHKHRPLESGFFVLIRRGLDTMFLK